ncbi:hypothetical protein ACO34A_23455 (plasmid) [Rhizobium sp. ACO-34A]|nr:hypothetical protein ACO34A_23455 [Rhizobium sp. ACO-34A]
MWELPLVLIMKSTCLINIRRIFPFDSGAFHSSRLPSYVSRFEHEGYEVANRKGAIDLLIDIFFGDDKAYFHGRSKSRDDITRRNGLNVRHAQVLALCALYNREQLEADDRALAIEIQTDQDVIIKDNLMGVILPRPYFDDSDLRKFFKENGVIVKQYDTYPINSEGYIAEVYTAVKSIYEKKGLIDG